MNAGEITIRISVSLPSWAARHMGRPYPLAPLADAARYRQAGLRFKASGKRRIT